MEQTGDKLRFVFKIDGNSEELLAILREICELARENNYLQSAEQVRGKAYQLLIFGAQENLAKLQRALKDKGLASGVLCPRPDT